METRKKTKKQKIVENAAFMERLRNTPDNQLSPAARWVLNNADRWSNVKYDIKAVLK